MKKPFYGTFLVEEIDSAMDLDGVIIGAPFEDEADFYDEGVKDAPAKIRENSHFFSGQGMTKESIHQKNFLDIGNIETVDNFYDKHSEIVQKALSKNAIPISIGGDHSVALSTAKGIAKAKKKIDGIIWFDAHLDLMNEFPEGANKTRATVLRRIIELEIIEPQNIYFIGVRGHNLGWEEVEFVNKNKMKYLSAFDLSDQKKTEGFIEGIISKCKNLYVSVDIDVLDPAFAPGVSVPEPGGITSRELFKLIKQIASKTICLDLVEYNPLKDFNDITAKTACKIIYHFIDSL